MDDVNKSKRQLIDELLKIRQEITLLKKKEKEHQRIERQYRFLFESLPIGIAIASLDGEILIFNDAMLKMMGYSETELKRINVRDTFLNLQERILLMQLLLAAGIVRDFEVELKRKDGTPFYANLTTTRLVLQGRDVLLTMIQDISERKEAEIALLESEEKFRSLAEQSPNMIFINSMGRIVYANQTCEKIMGYTIEEFYDPDFDFLVLVSPEFKEILKKNYRKHQKGEEVVQQEYTYVRKNGRKIAGLTATKLISYGGETAILGIVTDIAEQKRILEQLRESKEGIKNLFEHAQVGLLRTRIDDGKLLECNDLFASLAGYKNREECLAKFIASEHYFDPNARARMLKEIQKNGEIRNFEIHALRADGAPIWVSYSARIFPERNCIEGSVLDITERKRAEQALQESEEKYRLIFENTPLGILHYDKNGVITACNENLAQILGAPKDMLVGFNMTTSLANQKVRDAVVTSLSGKTAFFEGDYTSVISGKTTIVKADFGPFIAEDGSLIGGIGIAEDVTEQKQTEEIARKGQELSTLYSITSILTQNLSLKEKLSQAFERVIELFDIEVGGGIYLLNHKTSMLHMFISKGLPPDFVKNVEVVPLDHSRALKTNKPVVQNNISTDSKLTKELRKQVKKISLRAFVSIPMKQKDRSIGIMNLAHHTPGKHFTKAEVNLLQIICQQFTQTIENHRFVAAMLESETQYQEIFDNVTDMILISDLNTKIHTANPSALRWLGYSEAELYTMKWHNLVQEKADLKARIKLIRHQGAINNWPLTFISKSGREIPAEMDITLITREGKPVEFLGVVRDITERLQLQRETLRSQKMASLSLLVSGISHEFNNILGTIHTWVTFAKRDTENRQTITEMLETVETQTGRGRTIVRDLLLFSGNYQPAFRAIKLWVLLDKNLAKMREEFDKKKIQVQTFYHYKGVVEADSYQLGILFNNLLTNSIHALVGKKQKKIIIRVVAQHETVRITIFDNGRGMSEKTASHIFEPFFTTKDNSMEGKGIGVGLAICYGIVENHGGHLTVESQSKVGTTFFITMSKKCRPRKKYSSGANRAD